MVTSRNYHTELVFRAVNYNCIEQIWHIGKTLFKKSSGTYKFSYRIGLLEILKPPQQIFKSITTLLIKM